MRDIFYNKVPRVKVGANYTVPNPKRKCAVCQEGYTATTRMQKYCPVCRKEVESDRAKKSYIKKREERRLNKYKKIYE